MKKSRLNFTTATIKKIVIFFLCLIVLLCGYVITNRILENNIISKLNKNWHTLIDPDTFDKYWLTFDDQGNVIYEYDSIIQGRSAIAALKYSLKSLSKIEIDGELYEIHFQGDKDELVFTPAIYGEKNWFE